MITCNEADAIITHQQQLASIRGIHEPTLVQARILYVTTAIHQTLQKSPNPKAGDENRAKIGIETRQHILTMLKNPHFKDFTEAIAIGPERQKFINTIDLDDLYMVPTQPAYYV